jgi:Coenzyme PQQ synthesis protein D (PqqD)
MTQALYLARSRRIAARKLGDEMLVMSAHGSTLFTLNRTATILWQSADGATPLEQIVADKICSEYEVSADEALRDAESLASDLANHGILLVSQQPIAPSAVREGNL